MCVTKGRTNLSTTLSKGRVNKSYKQGSNTRLYCQGGGQRQTLYTRNRRRTNGQAMCSTTTIPTGGRLLFTKSYTSWGNLFSCQRFFRGTTRGKGTNQTTYPTYKVCRVPHVQYSGTRKAKCIRHLQTQTTQKTTRRTNKTTTSSTLTRM